MMSSVSSLIHGTFTVSRDLTAPPERVFAAYAEPGRRRRWFRMPGRTHYDLDFRVGGAEISRGAFAPTGEREERLEYRGTFHDIAADERVVFSYELTVDDVRRWASLVTVELAPSEDGTCLRHTEQYVLLAYTADGAHDTAHLEGGTRLQLNGLAAALG
jgi:uncharacterized protein YndB with AHSA1/START domain